MSEREEFDKVFVSKWLEAIATGKRADWIGDELHISKIYVLNKASNLRKKGVKMPRLQDGRYTVSPEHVAELNNLIEETK